MIKLEELIRSIVADAIQMIMFSHPNVEQMKSMLKLWEIGLFLIKFSQFSSK
jgi:hypothetical protein